MGENVEFPSNGSTCSGYLAPTEATGPGVVVIQEWWGLNDHIKNVCDRLASEGFTALAPDLYHGQATKEPDEAGKLMMDLNIEQAAKDMSGAVAYLKTHDKVAPPKIGSIGFCMGGALSLWLASLTDIAACVDYYGGPYKSQPDYSKIKSPFLGHFAEHDDWASKEVAEEIQANLSKAGGEATIHFYSGTEHAFFNDTRDEVYKEDAAKLSWNRTLDFYRGNLK